MKIEWTHSTNTLFMFDNRHIVMEVNKQLFHINGFYIFIMTYFANIELNLFELENSLI